MTRFMMTMCIGAALCAYGQAPTDPLLKRIREKMAGNLERLPDYTCTETIERSVRKPGKGFEPLDTVRVEVAFVGGKELISWPGTRFEDRDIRAFVPNNGAIGTGNFALEAHNIFRTKAPIFSGPFEGTRDGRRAIRYDFKVPRAVSEMRVETDLRGAMVGYHGSFWVGAESLDLLRLETRSDEIPDELEISATSESVAYARVSIGGAEFLLPSASELTMLRRVGRESRNRARFSNCRQYQGESTISFVDAAPVAETPKAPRIVELPANLNFEAALTAAIDIGTAAIGDPVSLVVSKPVKKGSTIVVPKGAILKGRLTRIEKRSSNEGPFHVIGILLSSLEAGDSRSDFVAILQEAGMGDRYFVPFATEVRGPLWTYLTLVGIKPAPGEGILLVRANTTNPLPAGLRMRWQTAGQRPRTRRRS